MYPLFDITPVRCAIQDVDNRKGILSTPLLLGYVGLEYDANFLVQIIGAVQNMSISPCAICEEREQPL